MKYNKVLLDKIDNEKNGVDYICQGNDILVLEEMFGEINYCCGTNIRYLAEIDFMDIVGSGTIMAKYIDRFHSESVRCYLLPQIVSDKVADSASIIIKSYFHFKESDEYISSPNEPAPAHIYVRYDNAFRKLKSKAIKSELVKLAYYPRDVFYLPFTMVMLASWKVPELEQVFLSYLDDSYVTNELLGLPRQDQCYYPSASHIKRELNFTAIACLKYYPSIKVLAKLNEYSSSEDNDIRLAVNKTMRTLNKSHT